MKTLKIVLLALVLAIVAIVPVGVVLYNCRLGESPVGSVEFEGGKPPQKLETGMKLRVKACKVIDGYRYDVLLDNDRWMEAHLAVAAKEEATTAALAILDEAAQTSNPPTLTLLRQVGKVWIVDFSLTTKDGKRESMSALLGSRGLLLER